MQIGTNQDATTRENDLPSRLSIPEKCVEERAGPSLEYEAREQDLWLVIPMSGITLLTCRAGPL